MKFILVVVGVLLTSQVYANSIENVLKNYQGQGASSFNAQRGKVIWEKKNTSSKDPKSRNCQTCHGANLRKSGEHVRSGKVIKPMAPSVNKKRYTEVKKIEKWFKRNCKYTLGRVCTPQEKGDMLTYLKTL